MSSLIDLPAEILAQIYIELLTNDKKEFWPQLRGTTRTCIEAEMKYQDENDDILFQLDGHNTPTTRPCVGEVKEPSRWDIPSPNDSTNEDDDDDESEDEDASQNWEFGTGLPPGFNDLLDLSFPHHEAPKSQHTRCTNRYFLHPAILATNSHINAGASAVLYGRNAFHFALDWDDSGNCLSNAPWAKHVDKIRDIHLTQNCSILGRRDYPMIPMRKNVMWDRFSGVDHWGDRESRDDLCSIINSLLFSKNVHARFQTLRLDLGNAMRWETKNADAPSTAVLFDQLTKAVASLDIVQQLDIHITARAMQSKKWTIFARNVAKSINWELQIFEEDPKNGEYHRGDFFHTRFLIRREGGCDGTEVAGL